MVIARLGHKTIAATLKNVTANPGTITNWENQDYGQAVYNQQVKGYQLRTGLPRIFYLFVNDYQETAPWIFNFDFHWHLVLKDKDELKPYYWYYYDYSPTLSQFIHGILQPFISLDNGEIVALPAEQGQACTEWEMSDYQCNYSYCGEDEEFKDYDFGSETAAGWQKVNGRSGLVITFLPTYWRNYELKKGQKLTGTTWFKKIWQVFGVKGVPIVLKCYRAFVFVNLYRHYRQLYDQISSITKLPTSIDGREVGKSNLLVYFNCPFLAKKITYR